MPALLVDDLGHGPDIVLLHGVGVGPETFATLAALLAVDHRVLVLERPVGPGGGAVPLEEQAAAIAAELLGASAAGARVVGVSGGATVALVLALGHTDVVGSLVVHEPLVGRHAPELHARFASAAVRTAESDDAAVAVVREVLGEPAWRRLEASGRDRVVAGAPRSRAEIPLFAAFDPSAADLARLRPLPVLVTVGSESGSERMVAAKVLTDLAGASIAVVPGTGNAAQIDAPEAFAGMVRAWRPMAVGCGT